MEKDTHKAIGRMVINNRELENNTITKADFKTTVVPIIKEIVEELLAHSGPNAEYGLLLDPSDLTSDAVFTNDGINIVRSINYINPVSEAVRKLVQHIGGKIDRAAYDGTTSSMIVALTAMIELMENDFIERTPFAKLVDNYTSFIKDVENQLESEVWTIDRLCAVYAKYGYTRDEVIYQIAYSQAYTSSHGDKDLSEVVAKAFVANQCNNFGTIIIDRAMVENEDLWSVKTTSEQFETDDVVVIDGRMNNKELQTAVEHLNTTLMVHHGELNDNDANATRIFDAIKAIAEDDTDEKSLVVLVAGMSAGMRSNIIMGLQELNIFDKVAVCVKAMPFNPDEVNELLVLRNLVVEPTGTMKDLTVIEGVDFKVYDNDLKISNIFERTPEGLHPNYGDETKMEFSSIVKQLETIMERLREDTTPAKIKKLNDVCKVYNRLVYPTTTSIIIGGTSHENISNMDILIDVVGATRNALNKGFTCGGMSSLKSCMKVLNKMYGFSPSGECKSIINDGFMVGIEKLEEHLSLPHHIKVTRAENVSYDLLTDKCQIIGEKIEEVDAQLSEVIDPWIIQPAAINITLLKRFKEVCLKFIKTSTIIVRGGIKTL